MTIWNGSVGTINQNRRHLMGNQETGRKIMMDLLNNPVGDQDTYVMELQRLLMCYQIASPDDKNVVWAALNKYAGKIDKI
jgi:hypothetical protein